MSKHENCNNLSRRQFLAQTASLTAAWALSPMAIAAATQTKDKLNVLFIATDDLRTNLGCYGNPNAVTPNIDRLASRGITFNHAYCQITMCNPSRASVMTGRRPDTTRVWDLNTHFRKALPDVVTLPQHFKQHGYYTQGIGKVFHQTPKAQDAPSWSVPVQYYHELAWDKRYALPANRTGDKVTAAECADVPDNYYQDGKITDTAIESLRENKDKPFFLAVGFYKPHLPFCAPKKYWDLYDRDKLAKPANPNPPVDVPPMALHCWEELRAYNDIPNKGPLEPDTIAKLRHGYYACTSYTDAQVGRVLDELDRLGLTKRTVVILWSDHGYHLGEHNIWAKMTNFELDTHVPLILSVPGRKNTPARTDALVEYVDIYPTLVELCGLEMPKGLEGTSTTPLLDDPKLPWKKAAFSQFARPYHWYYDYSEKLPENMGYSMRTLRWRYTEWVNFKTGKLLASELYDHENDPAETVNLAYQQKYKLIIEQLGPMLRTGCKIVQTQNRL